MLCKINKIAEMKTQKKPIILMSKIYSLFLLH